MTDEQIVKDIVDHLSWDYRVDASNIQVEVTNGRVRLFGTVPVYTARQIAELACCDVKGVTSGVGRLRGRSIVTVGLLFFSFLFFTSLCGRAQAEDAQELVKEALDYYRGDASISLVEMTIHRPDWERTLTIKAWTKGIEYSLFFILAPAKDRGNGTLKKGRNMWMYNPKVNRVIKIPPSMMSQPWMGSDFSNNDLAKSDSILVDYTHSVAGTETHEGKKVYLINCIPKPAAPVVWGLQKVKIREDHILLSEDFYDEEHRLVKAFTSRRIMMMGGKLFPKFWKMQKAGSRDYTLLEYKELTFKEDLPERRFSLSSLRNPPRR